MTTTSAELAPIIKTAVVPQDPPGAFRIFTEEIGSWWPLASHSVGADAAQTVRFGRAVGEQIIEVFGADERSSWGTITAWDPPARVAFTWHPGTPETEATTVEVTFVADGRGTKVTLTHAGWANRPDALRAYEGYGPGWDFVLGRYRSFAGS